jgi:hypothetical protein
MGIAAPELMPTLIPTKDGTLPEGCGVPVILGTDKAGKPLTGMGGSATTGSTSPLRPRRPAEPLEQPPGGMLDAPQRPLTPVSPNSATNDMCSIRS